MPDLVYLSANEMAERIRSRQVSPVELMQAHLSRIEQLNPKLNAFVEVDAEGALRLAKAAEGALARGAAIGSLHGVPVSIKSSIDVAKLRSEAGSRIRSGYRAQKDAPLVARLRSAGAIVLGTTNTPELLMAWETDNLLYGRTNNPWDLSRTPGGSSGGEAAAVASGCSAGGVGSDGGGSIRVPAHFCGICGLKPTPGRIPGTGHYPSGVGPFGLLGVVGPMARTVADLKLFFEVLQGLDYGDTLSAPVSVRWPAAQEVKQARIGWFVDEGRTPVTDETRAAVNCAAEALGTSGLRVAPFCPEGLDQAQPLWWKFFGVAGAMLLGPIVEGREQEVSPILKQFSGWAAAEKPHTAETLLATWIERDMLRERIFSEMQNCPILLCPVASVPAFRHGEREWQIDGKTVKYLDAWSYCEWFNLLGMPGAVVPVGRSAEGLPIGVQIVGLPWQEELVLSVAEILQDSLGAWKAPPEI
jgi:Asp-tRNA(Asn)/Glu-tRNA(Gln) amidotransferase A subunit family amidase